MIQKAFVKTEKGIDVRLTGDVIKTQFETMVSECNSGSCGCKCDSGLKDRIAAAYRAATVT